MALPTAWQLLIPNFNIFTIIGVLIILVVIFGGTFLKGVSTFLSKISGGKLNLGSINISLIIVALLLIFGVSIIQDFLSTTQGTLLLVGIFLMIVAIGIVISDRLKKVEKR